MRTIVLGWMVFLTCMLPFQGYPQDLPVRVLEVRIVVQIGEEFVDTLNIENWLASGVTNLRDHFDRVLAYLIFAEEIGLESRTVEEISTLSSVDWDAFQQQLHLYGSRRFGLQRWGDFTDNTTVQQIEQRFAQVLSRGEMRIVDKKRFTEIYSNWSEQDFVTRFVRLGFR